MSVLEQIARLRENIAVLNTQIANLRNEQIDLNYSKSLLQRKLQNGSSYRELLVSNIRRLETHTAPIAKVLVDSYRTQLQEQETSSDDTLNEICYIDRKISKSNVRIEEIKNDVLNIEKAILDLKIDPSDHIDEQTSKIVDDFFKYVEKNKLKFAEKISQTFVINSYLDDTDNSKTTTIPNELIYYYTSIDGKIFFIFRDYYELQKVMSYSVAEYSKKFDDVLMHKLVKRNPFTDTFKITFLDVDVPTSVFTLELV